MMGCSAVNFFYDQLFVKEPGTTERTPWHQDQPYWALQGSQICSLWVPLDPITKEVCVQYIAGSHRWPEYNPHKFGTNEPYQGTGLPELPKISEDDDRILTWAMEPGDCLVFNAMVVHGAPGNNSDEAPNTTAFGSNRPTRRRALATRWAGDDVSFAVRKGEVGYPVSNRVGSSLVELEHGEPLRAPWFPRV